MMNAQQSISAAAASTDVRAVPAGGVVALDAGGEVAVVSGRVWLTVAGDPDDHILGPGESMTVPPWRHALLEAWGRGVPAQIAWRRPKLGDLFRRRVSGTCSRCWQLMNPAGRIGIGGAAALVALVAAVSLFGPVADARSRALSGPMTRTAVLHNAADVAACATDARGSLADGSDTRDGPRVAAPKAGRRAAGPA